MITMDYKDKKLNLYEVAELAGISYNKVYHRWKRGETVSDIIKNPILRAKKVEVRGEWLTFKEMGDKYGLNYHICKNRYSNGLRGEDLIKNIDRIKCMFHGEERYLMDLSEEYGIKYSTLYARLNRGDRDDILVRKPREINLKKNNSVYKSKIRIEYKGKMYSTKKLSELLGINERALYARYRRGETGEELFRPKRKLNKIDQNKTYLYNGEQLNMIQILDKLEPSDRDSDLYNDIYKLNKFLKGLDGRDYYEVYTNRFINVDKLYKYEGKLRTLKEISDLTGVKVATVRSRICKGLPMSEIGKSVKK